MGKKLTCQDLGVTCPFEAHGETEDEVIGRIAKHAKEVHGYTDEQLSDPEMMKKVKEAIKEE